jgi:hypothetical protein
MALSQRMTSYGKLFVLCCIFLGSVVANINVNELPQSSYAVWGSALADWNNIMEFNPMTGLYSSSLWPSPPHRCLSVLCASGEAGQVVLKNDNKFMAGLALAVNLATKTLYWPIVELESGGPGEVQDSLTHPLTHSPTYSLMHLQSQLAIVNTTSKPWVYHCWTQWYTLCGARLLRCSPPARLAIRRRNRPTE